VQHALAEDHAEPLTQAADACRPAYENLLRYAM
jgi:hypothetical protein